MTRAEIIEKLKLLEPALRAEGIAHLAIFGSRARQDARPDSDLDILVDVADSAAFSLLDLIGTEHLVSDALGLTANATISRNLDPALRAALTKDVVVVF